MSQNRNKLIELLIGNISNVVLHRILEKAINKPEIAKRYSKETANRVKSELQARILKGYENINTDDAEEFVENALKEIKVT